MQRSGKKPIGATEGTDDDSLVRIKLLLRKHHADELIDKLQGENSGSSFTNEELIYVIENKSLPQRVRTAAYLSLLQFGQLQDLQRLSNDIDFSFIDKFGNDAFRNAVAFGRLEVVKWFVENIPQFQKIDVERRTEIILLAVYNDRVECLEHFAKPVADGGFGWDLNVRHKNGYSPVKFALRHQNESMALRLVASQEEGGFGLPLKQEHLRTLVDNPKLTMYSGFTTNANYHRKKPATDRKPERKKSSFQIYNPKTCKNEYYEPKKLLGTGGFGIVRLFACTTAPEKVVAVKQCHLDKQRPMSGFGMFEAADSNNIELKFLKKMYPEIKPYLIKHYINKNGQYDYRMVMPFAEGVDMLFAAFKAVNSRHFAAIILAVANELQRMHQLGIVHGDIKVQNIVIADHYRDKNTISAKFIDFGCAEAVGEQVGYFDEECEYLAPERCHDTGKPIYAEFAQDIYSFAYIVKQYVEVYNRRFPQQEKLLAAEFPSLMKFYENGINVLPEKRPKLDDFIRELKEDLSMQRIHSQFDHVPDQQRNSVYNHI